MLTKEQAFDRIYYDYENFWGEILWSGDAGKSKDATDFAHILARIEMIISLTNVKEEQEPNKIGFGTEDN